MTGQRQSRDSPETVHKQSTDSPETVQRQSRDSVRKVYHGVRKIYQGIRKVYHGAKTQYQTIADMSVLVVSPGFSLVREILSQSVSQSVTLIGGLETMALPFGAKAMVKIPHTGDKASLDRCG